jgi:hypothetical protein
MTTKREESLSAIRFTRIPAIDAGEAEEIRAVLEATGVWNVAGERVVLIDDAMSRILELRVPASFGATSTQIGDQVGAMLATHEFVALFRISLADFFDAQR